MPGSWKENKKKETQNPPKCKTFLTQGTNDHKNAKCLPPNEGDLRKQRSVAFDPGDRDQGAFLKPKINQQKMQPLTGGAESWAGRRGGVDGCCL